MADQELNLLILCFISFLVRHVLFFMVLQTDICPYNKTLEWDIRMSNFLGIWGFNLLIYLSSILKYSPQELILKIFR